MMKTLRYILDYGEEPYVQIPLSEYNRLIECEGCERLCNKHPRGSKEPCTEPARTIEKLRSKIKECRENIEENTQAIEFYEKAINHEYHLFFTEVRNSAARSLFERRKKWWQL